MTVEFVADAALPLSAAGDLASAADGLPTAKSARGVPKGEIGLVGNG